MRTPTSEALADVREYMAIKAHREAREKIEAAIDEQARAICRQFGFDMAAIRFQRDRYMYGSLSLNHEAADERRVLYRALEIAAAAQANQIAAE